MQSIELSNYTWNYLFCISINMDFISNSDNDVY